MGGKLSWEIGDCIRETSPEGKGGLAEGSTIRSVTIKGNMIVCSRKLPTRESLEMNFDVEISSLFAIVLSEISMSLLTIGL